MGGPNSSEQRVQKILRELRSGSRLGWDDFAKRVGDAGFQVSPAAVRGYEEGRTKKVPIAYVDAVCRAFGASPTRFVVEDSSESSRSPLLVELQETLDLAFGRCIGAAGRPLALAVLPNRLVVQAADPLDLEIAVLGNSGEEPAP